MSETEPRNNLSWRVTVLEREMDRLKEGKPDVVAERVEFLSRRVTDLRDEVKEDMRELQRMLEAQDEKQVAELGTQRKILIGAFISIATGLILAYVLGAGGIPA